MNLADYFCIAGVCAKNISLDTQMIYQFSKSNGIYSVEFNDKLFNINKIENQYG
jgi:hypothetical protein